MQSAALSIDTSDYTILCSDSFLLASPLVSLAAFEVARGFVVVWIF